LCYFACLLKAITLFENPIPTQPQEAWPSMHLRSSCFNELEERLKKLELACPYTPAEEMALRQIRINARLAALLRATGTDVQEASLSSSSLATVLGQQQQQQQQQLKETLAAGQPPLAPDATPTHQRLHNELVQKGFSAFRFVRVPADYYEQPLEYRQAKLGAASVSHLCKSIFMENTRIHPSAIDPDDPLSPANWANPVNSRYYVILVQYAARLNADKLKKLVHQMNGSAFGKQFFNFRLAPEFVSNALSGYTHNAVTPIGMKASSVPMIMSHLITELQPEFFFLGAGETDLKVGLPASEFVAKFSPLVADITY